MISSAGQSYIKKEMARYETKESAIIPALYQAQKEYGFINGPVIDELAKLMDIPTSRIYEVAHFYTMFNKKAVGKYHIQFCTNIVCACTGARELMDHTLGKLQVKADEVTKDGKFTVSGVECLGSCGTGPMAQVNDDYHENLTPQKMDKLLESLK